MLSLGGWKAAGLALALAGVSVAGALTTRALERSWRHEAEADKARVEGQLRQAVDANRALQDAMAEQTARVTAASDANAARLQAANARARRAQEAAAAIIEGGKNVLVENACPGVARALDGLRVGPGSRDAGSDPGMVATPR